MISCIHARPGVLLVVMLEHPHYTFGFHGPCSSGGGPDRRAALFDAYAAGLADTFAGLFDMPVHEAWVEANEIVEGSGINWTYRRVESDQTSYLARGSC